LAPVDDRHEVLVTIVHPVQIEKPGYLLFTPTLIRWFDTISFTYSILLHYERKLQSFLILSVSS
jgi:hypothetical protein